jgi:hypothetical protein
VCSLARAPAVLASAISLATLGIAPLRRRRRRHRAALDYLGTPRGMAASGQRKPARPGLQQRRASGQRRRAPAALRCAAGAGLASHVGLSCVRESAAGQQRGSKPATRSTYCRYAVISRRSSDVCHQSSASLSMSSSSASLSMSSAVSHVMSSVISQPGRSAALRLPACDRDRDPLPPSPQPRGSWTA